MVVKSRSVILKTEDNLVIFQIESYFLDNFPYGSLHQLIDNIDKRMLLESGTYFLQLGDFRDFEILDD